MASSIFISSTCYDLIDLRAELSDYIKGMSLIPLLSDDADSGFQGAGNNSSIEVCLDNVRKSDVFLLVLSQRYGALIPSHEKSATHLEYLEALKSRKRMVVFIRKPLLQEYEIFRGNRATYTPTNWLKNEKSAAAFLSFVEEVKKLKGPNEANWVWPFDDSTDIKRRLNIELANERGASILQSLHDTGALPSAFLICKGLTRMKNQRTVSLTIYVENVGNATLFNPKMRIIHGGKGYDYDFGEALRCGLKSEDKMSLTIPDITDPNFQVNVTTEYLTIGGHILRDSGTLRFVFQDVNSAAANGTAHYRHVKKEYVSPASI